MTGAGFLAAVVTTAVVAIPLTLRYLVKNKNLGRAPKRKK